MMKIALSKPIREEKGQALILVMILLLVGSIIIAPLLGFMSTGLMAGQMLEERMDKLYAADAGIEDALWKIINLEEVPTDDPYYLTVNGMPVSIVIEEVTTFYTLDVGDGGTHNYYFELEVIYLSWAGGIHSYRLRLTNKTSQPVNLDRIIVSYSTELSYSSGLTNGNIDGLADPPKGDFESGNPGSEIVVGSTTILTWDFPSPRPEIVAAPDPGNEDYTTVTTTFGLAGPEDAAGVTVLLVTARDDIGTVWEFKPFKITATALADDGSTVVIEAGILEGSDTVKVRSWEIE